MKLKSYVICILSAWDKVKKYGEFRSVLEIMYTLQYTVVYTTDHVDLSR